jgi:hypothetical protein
VKQDLSFVKEAVSAPTGEAFRAIRQRPAQAQGKKEHVVEAQPTAQPEAKKRYVTQVEPQPTAQPQAQPEATTSPPSALDQMFMDLVQIDNQLSPEEKVMLIHRWYEESKKKVNF